MSDLRDEFLSEEDLDLANLSWDELVAHWELWLREAQVTNDLDVDLYEHGVFEFDPAKREAGEAARRALRHPLEHRDVGG